MVRRECVGAAATPTPNELSARFSAVYDQPLAIDQALTRLEEQPEAIAAVTVGLPRARLHTPPSGREWSVNDVLAHLRSCADMWGKYIAMIIVEDHPTIRAMNPTTWIKSTNYPSSNSRHRSAPLGSSVTSCWRSCGHCQRQRGHEPRRLRAPESHTNGRCSSTRGGSLITNERI